MSGFYTGSTMPRVLKVPMERGLFIILGSPQVGTQSVRGVQGDSASNVAFDRLVCLRVLNLVLI